MNLKRIALAIPDLAEKEPKLPTEFRIFAFGQTETEKGTYAFDAESARNVIENARKWGNRFSLDYEHRALHAAESGEGPAPAAGWYDLELRADGLYAVNIEWTERAKAYLLAREYRYVSPAFSLDEKGRPSELLNVALTNLPATRDMQPIAATKLHNPSEEKPMKHLLAALSLAETATEGDALAALTKMKEAGAPLLVLTGKSTMSEAIGVVAGWKGEAEKVIALSSKLAEVEKASRAAEVEALIAAGKAEGKVTPALEAFCRELGGRDAAQLKAFLSVATPAVPTSPVKAPADGGSCAALSDEDMHVARQLRTDTKALTEAKTRIEASRQ